MRTPALAFAVLVGYAGSAAAQVDRDRLVGSWSLVSYQLAYEGEAPRNVFGERPTGRIILSPEGKVAAVFAAEGRRAGTGEAERAGLHRGLVAYTGRWRVEGDRFIIAVDTAWNKAWEGTEQVGDIRLEGDRVVNEVRGTGTDRPGTVFVARLVWERER
jgi:hypothetical protein